MCYMDKLIDEAYQRLVMPQPLKVCYKDFAYVSSQIWLILIVQLLVT